MAKSKFKACNACTAPHICRNNGSCSAAVRVVNTPLDRRAAVRRLYAKVGPNALERLLITALEHQGVQFDMDDESLESIDGDALVTFFAEWRKRLIQFVN